MFTLLSPLLHVSTVRGSWSDEFARIFRLDTIDGTATAGEDYVKLSEEFKMERGQQEKRITIHVIDDNQWEPDETFFVKLSLPEGQDTRAKLGSKTIALVTIINDDGNANRRARERRTKFSSSH